MALLTALDAATALPTLLLVFTCPEHGGYTQGVDFLAWRDPGATLGEVAAELGCPECCGVPAMALVARDRIFGPDLAGPRVELLTREATG